MRDLSVTLSLRPWPWDIAHCRVWGERETGITFQLSLHNFTKMPLFFHRQSSLPTTTATSPSYSSKLLKPLKPNSAPVPTRSPLPIIVFSLVSLFIGLAGTIFAITALRRPTPIPVFRCGKSEDTFRAFYSLSTSRQLGDKNGGLVDRPKLLGFVGIQTGFGSADRRAALRRTWFPSDPDGLLR